MNFIEEGSHWYTNDTNEHYTIDSVDSMTVTVKNHTTSNKYLYTKAQFLNLFHQIIIKK